MKADDRILGAARKAKGCPFQGSSRVPQPWQDLKASRALKTRLFGDRRFEPFFLQWRVERTPESGGSPKSTTRRRGTNSSNPSLSSGESGANSVRTAEVTRSRGSPRGRLHVHISNAFGVRAGVQPTRGPTGVIDT
jgi:hypothetical protein